jgi:hypothetical protein
LAHSFVIWIGCGGGRPNRHCRSIATGVLIGGRFLPVVILPIYLDLSMEHSLTL